MSSKRFYDDRNDFTKGTNFSIDETEALLQGIRDHKHVVFAQTQYNGGCRGAPGVSLLQRKIAWQDISEKVDAVRTVNGGERRTIVQLKQRWKNLKQRAYRDFYQELEDASGQDETYKRGEYTNVVVELIGKDRIMAVCGGGKTNGDKLLHERTSVSVAPPSTSAQDEEAAYTAYSIKEELMRSEDDPILINDSESSQPGTSQSNVNVNNGIARSNNGLTKSNSDVASSNNGRPNLIVVEPARKKQKVVQKPVIRHQQLSSRIHALPKPSLSLQSTLRNVPRLVKPSQDRQLVAAETERALAQARLAEEQTKLATLRQQETKLRMLLLQSKLQDVGMVLGEGEEDQIPEIELDLIDNNDEF